MSKKQKKIKARVINPSLKALKKNGKNKTIIKQPHTKIEKSSDYTDVPQHHLLNLKILSIEVSINASRPQISRLGNKFLEETQLNASQMEDVITSFEQELIEALGPDHSLVQTIKELRDIQAEMVKTRFNYLNNSGTTSTEADELYLKLKPLIEKHEIDINQTVPQMEKFISKHPEYHDYSVFDIACSQPWLLMLIELIERPDLDINHINSQNLTPLLIAYKHRHMDVTEYLLKNPKIDPNIKTKGNITLLHLACCYGNTKIAELILANKKTDPNAYIEPGYWPMFNDCEANPFNIAILNRHFNIADLILEDNRFKPVSSDELLMVLLSTYPDPNQQLTHLKKLIDKGADPDQKMKLLEQKFEGNSLSMAKFLNLSHIICYLESFKSR